MEKMYFKWEIDFIETLKFDGIIIWFLIDGAVIRPTFKDGEFELNI